MVFADRLPDKWTNYDVRIVLGHLPTPVRPVRHHSPLPSQARRPAVRRRFGYAIGVTRKRYVSPRTSIAQTMRAVLWAKAVAATGIGRRASSGVNHGRGRTLGRLTAPTTALAP
jgi:hypothetical protein